MKICDDRDVARISLAESGEKPRAEAPVEGGDLGRCACRTVPKSFIRFGRRSPPYVYHMSC